MPEKITSKNLSYNSTLPPFLARLHAQAAGSQGPDPLLAAHKRSSKKRSSSEEAEDAPLIVDEHGNSVNVQIEKDGTVKEAELNRAGHEDGRKADEAAEEKRESDVKSSIGVRKRKVGRVIGEDTSVHQDKIDGGDKQKAASKEVKLDKKAKKKAKKIKLSFDQDEG